MRNVALLYFTYQLNMRAGAYYLALTSVAPESDLNASVFS